GPNGQPRPRRPRRMRASVARKPSDSPTKRRKMLPNAERLRRRRQKWPPFNRGTKLRKGRRRNTPRARSAKLGKRSNPETRPARRKRWREPKRRPLAEALKPSPAAHGPDHAAARRPVRRSSYRAGMWSRRATPSGASRDGTMAPADATTASTRPIDVASAARIGSSRANGSICPALCGASNPPPAPRAPRAKRVGLSTRSSTTTAVKAKGTPMQRIHGVPARNLLARTARRLSPKASQLRVARGLAPYVWPSDRPDLQATVAVSLGLMLLAKLVTVAMPFTFKWATDALVAAAGGAVPAEQSVKWLVGAPVLATLLYGLSRVTMSLLVQAREGMFAKVALHAVRKLALTTFEHMHRLSLRFHLERKTGGLTRVLERGRAGIENITRMTLMTVVPAIGEVALVVAVLMFEFDWRYALAVVVMISLYLWFTVRATDWRIKIRRTMNESDSEANTKAIDSLLNYETVKYFGAEEREATRYDRSMAVYQEASVKSYTSLALLNAGQAVIFTMALTACMVMAGLDIAAGSKTVGHFVM